MDFRNTHLQEYDHLKNLLIQLLFIHFNVLMTQTTLFQSKLQNYIFMPYMSRYEDPQHFWQVNKHFWMISPINPVLLYMISKRFLRWLSPVSLLISSYLNLAPFQPHREYTFSISIIMYFKYQRRHKDLLFN
jgi:hypothetical protein